MADSKGTTTATKSSSTQSSSSSGSSASTTKSTSSGSSSSSSERKTVKIEELASAVRRLPISVTDKRLLGEQLATEFDVDPRQFYELSDDPTSTIGRPGVMDPHVEHEQFTQRKDEETTYSVSPTPAVQNV